MEETHTELARRAQNAAFNAGYAEAERLTQRAADFALKIDVPEEPLSTNMALERLMDLLFTNMALERLMDLATSDTWSGRSNDMARCYRDGFVAGVREIQNRMEP